MSRVLSRKSLLTALAGAAIAATAGCGPQNKVAAAPPPPPAPAPIPPQPVPPMGASLTLVVPPLDAAGVRQSVNTGVSPTQATWNLRSAFNVAALNCLQPLHAPILPGYRAFLRTHARVLAAANRGVDAEFRKKNGPGFIAPREAYMTKVYNYYAFPPTLPAFCDAALAIGQEAQIVKSADLGDFAVRSLPKIDAVFDSFYRSYEQYRVDLAAWQNSYGTFAAAQGSTASAEPTTQFPESTP